MSSYDLQINAQVYTVEVEAKVEPQVTSLRFDFSLTPVLPQ